MAPVNGSVWVLGDDDEEDGDDDDKRRLSVQQKQQTKNFRAELQNPREQQQQRQRRPSDNQTIAPRIKSSQSKCRPKMSHLQQLWPFSRVLVTAAAVVSRQSPFLGKGKVRSEQCADRETFDSAAAGGASLNERNMSRVKGRREALTTMARRLELEKKERASA